MSNMYAFQAEPRPLAATPPAAIAGGGRTITTTMNSTQQRSIYRNGAAPKVKSNLMNDKRIVRGSTYAPRGLPPVAALAQTLPRQAVSSQSKLATKRGGATRDMSTATATTSSISEVGRPATPEAVAGRHHMVTQTLEYREDLSKKKVLLESFTQTDAEKDYPTPPLFEPKSSGEDISTSIDNGALFDFEMEVEPVLHVLVTKALEEGLMEVCEEEELKELSDHRSGYRQQRDTHHADVQRLAAKDERRVDETQRRHQQSIQRVQRENELKTAQRTATEAHRAALTADEKQREEAALNAVLFDPMIQQVHKQFVPDLLSSAVTLLDQVSIAEEALSRVIDDSKAKQRAIVDDAHERSFASAMYQPGREKGALAEAKQSSHANERRRIGEVPLTSLQLVHKMSNADLEYDASRLERVRTQVRDDLRRSNEALKANLSLRGNGSDVTVIKPAAISEEVRRSHEKPTQTLSRLRGTLGVRCISLPPSPQRVNDDEAEEAPLGGAQITFVDPMMGAAQATLVVGDIITAIGDESVSNAQDVANIVSDLPVGDIVEVEVRRATSKATERIPVEVAAAYPSYSLEEVRKLRAAADLPVSDTDLWDQSVALTRLRRMHPKLGAGIVDPPAAAASATTPTDGNPTASTATVTGVRLNKIVTGGAAHRAGIRDDDKVMLVNGVALNNGDEFASTLEGCTPGDWLTVHIQRKAKWWKPKPPKPPKKTRTDDDDEDDEDDDDDENDDDNKEEDTLGDEPVEDDDDEDDDDEDNGARAKHKLVVGPATGRSGASNSKGILKGPAAGKESKDKNDAYDTPRNGDPLLSGPMSVRWRRRGLDKAPLSPSEIEEQCKKGEWEVVHVEVGARGSKNTLELVRSLRLVGGVSVCGNLVDPVNRRMIDPNGDTKTEKTSTTATPAEATPTSTAPLVIPRVSVASEKSVVAEVAAGLVVGEIGRRLRPDEPHDAIALLRACRPSIGFTYVPALNGAGVDVETIMPQGGAVQVFLTHGDRITMVGDREIKSVSDMAAAEHDLMVGDVVSVSVIRALTADKECHHIEIGAQHKWVTLTDIREWRRVAALHVHQSSLIDKPTAASMLRVMPPRLGAKIADTSSGTSGNGSSGSSVLVTGVEEGGAADRGGICTNDIIMSINGENVTNTESLMIHINRSLAGDQLSLTILRPNTNSVIPLTIVVSATAPAPPPTNEDAIDEQLAELHATSAYEYALSCSWRHDADIIHFVRSLRSLAALRV